MMLGLKGSKRSCSIVRKLSYPVCPASARVKRRMSRGPDSGDRSWEQVLAILSDLIKFKTRADGLGWRDAFENMHIYLQRVGLDDQELSKLQVVHVAGTKGKGSTCAMVESILRQCGYSTGLYTSPHLCDVTERIRINGKMVSKDDFAREFWWCYDRLLQKATEEVGVPGYFRILTILALHMFLRTQVEAVVLEVGMGGRLDATNVINHPVVCGITAIDYDHMEMLGDTLAKIAREKAGIMKPGSPAFTIGQQQPEALESLQACAAAVPTSFVQPPPLEDFTAAGGVLVDVGIAGAHQRLNAALAVQLAASFEAKSTAGKSKAASQERLHMLAQRILPVEYIEGLRTAHWPGRSQVVPDVMESVSYPSTGPEPTITSSSNSALLTTQQDSGRLTFYIDGAHSPHSALMCSNWFVDTLQEEERSRAGSPSSTLQQVRVLLFNCMKERDPEELIPAYINACRQRGLPLQHALFVPPESNYGFLAPNSGKPQSLPPPDLSWQLQMQRIWQAQHGAPSVAAAQSVISFPPLPNVPGLGIQQLSRGAVLPSLHVTLDYLRGCVRSNRNLQLKVLVTGSLYLAGDLLKLLGKEPV